MIQKLKQWKEMMLSIGIEEGYSDFQIEEIRNSNQGAVVSFLFSLIATLTSLIWISSPFIIIPIVCGFFYLFGLVANYYKKHKLGSMLLTVISLLLFFWLAEAYGKSSGAYLLFIIAEIMAIYSLKYLSPKAMIIQLSLPVILSIICYLTDFSLFPLSEISETAKQFLEPIMYFSVLLSCAIIVWSYSQNTQKHFKEMEAAKEALQKKYEELEAANEALTKTNEELDRFVYSVSHDLRAPISSAMGLITLCQIDKPNIDKYLGLQEQSMNKLDSFIKDILNYSRNSRSEIIPVVLDLPKMIKQNFKDLAYSQAAEDIQFEVEMRGENTIYSDEFRLNIVLSNLISNAIRYRNPQAKPSLLRFEIELQAQGAKILVKDNGLGISQQHISKIFNMFYRGHDKATGSGLGLYIVKQTLHKMQGKIQVESEEGKGTTFILEIPNLQMVG